MRKIKCGLIIHQMNSSSEDWAGWAFDDQCGVLTALTFYDLIVLTACSGKAILPRVIMGQYEDVVKPLHVLWDLFCPVSELNKRLATIYESVSRVQGEIRTWHYRVSLCDIRFYRAGRGNPIGTLSVSITVLGVAHDIKLVVT